MGICWGVGYKPTNLNLTAVLCTLQQPRLMPLHLCFWRSVSKMSTYMRTSSSAEHALSQKMIPFIQNPMQPGSASTLKSETA
eukprot:238447-Pelagomonas_calceolata.AAC.1